MKTCLNCEKPVNGHYCSYCGQPVSTGRFSLRSIMSGKISSSHQNVWNSGVLFTLIALIRRPGHSVREFVEGKRIHYFHFVGLIFILIVVEQFLKTYSPIQLSEITGAENKELTAFAEAFVAKYSRIITLACIPLFALISSLFFRRSGLNFAEHMVLNGYRIAGNMLIYTLLYIILIFVHRIVVFQWLIRTADLLSIIYTIWFMYQFFTKYNQKKLQLIFLSIGTAVGIYFTQFLIVVILLLIRIQQIT